MTQQTTLFSQEPARHRLCATATLNGGTTKAKSFGLSVALHGAIAGLLLFFAYEITPKPKLAPRIIDVVWGPDSNVTASAAQEASSPPSVSFVPLLIPPRPAPSSQTDLAPTQDSLAPAVVAPAAHAPAKPSHRPTPRPVTKTSAISTAHHPAPHINVNSVLDAPGHVSHSTSPDTNAPALTKAQQALSDSYVALLMRRLAQAHRKPPGLSDLLEATVTFHLNADGTMSDVRITQSSGNAAFDASVIAAFRRVQLPPPPTNLDTEDYDVTFKMKDSE